MKTNRFTSAIVMALAISLASCSRQSSSDQEAEQSTGSVPLFDDLGSHHHAVTTPNEMAQKYFDQGLRLVYGFNHDEAERAFRETARLDPKCAMAWWGVALALGPNINLPLDPERNQRAIDAVQKAQSLLSNASEPERAYVAAIAKRYSADPKADRVKLDREYGSAMKELSQHYPEDNDAAVLYAESLMDLKPWQLWTADGRPREGTEEILKTLESVLAREPNHPGANHYYIHAIEASPNPEKGLASAQRLKTLVPGAGHLVHMPAHIFIRTGDYDGAVEANATAVRADEAYISKTHAQGFYPTMYYIHNFQFLSAAAAMAGRSREALESAAKAVSLAAPMVQHEPMAEYVLPWSIFAMARFEKWDDILAYPRPADFTLTTLAFWHYARGLAHVAKANLSEAAKDRKELAAVESKVPEEFQLNLNRARSLLAIASSILDARLAEAAGDQNSAFRYWKKAVELQDGLKYDEPPAWYYPVRESLGGAYLRARRYPEAEQVFRRDLEINPNNARSLLGLREALHSQSKDIEKVSRRFEDAWKNADIKIGIDSL